MTYITGKDRSQLLLPPEAVEDYVDPDNAIRFIDAFVDGLDLEAAGFSRVHPKTTGRPGYDPGDLLKFYIYGYLSLFCFRQLSNLDETDEMDKYRVMAVTFRTR